MTCTSCLNGTTERRELVDVTAELFTVNNTCESTFSHALLDFSRAGRRRAGKIRVLRVDPRSNVAAVRNLRSILSGVPPPLAAVRVPAGASPARTPRCRRTTASCRGADSSASILVLEVHEPP